MDKTIKQRAFTLFWSVSEYKRAFTLIELMLVIFIISVLAALIFAGLGNSQARGRDARRKNDLWQLKLVNAQYANDHNDKYADNLSQLVPAYISNIPKDPRAGGDYQYTVENETDGHGCVVGSPPCFAILSQIENKKDYISDGVSRGPAGGTGIFEEDNNKYYQSANN